MLIALATFSRGASTPTPPDLITPPGLSEVVRLWPNEPPATSPVDRDDSVIWHEHPGGSIFAVRGDRMASLSVFLPANAVHPAPAIIICPGGGYAIEQMTTEGDEIAEALTKKGIAAFVLRYRLPNQIAPADDQLPMPQQDVLRAIQLVRSQADHWKIDPKRTGVMGFSAGGHLAATAATMYDQTSSFAAAAHDDAASQLSARPDFAVLAYPVITMEAATHGGTRANLLGPNPTPALLARFSADQHVTPQTPPLFIVVAEDDRTVPPVNSDMMDAAAQKAGIPHELLTYREGGHGFGLGAPEKTRGWLDKATTWLAKQGLIDPQPS